MAKPKPSTEQEFVAPDGGWGWMVVFGAGISSMFLISILQTFGLMFKDRFHELQFSATDTTSLMSMNSSFGMVLGIFNGPLLKKFGYRKISLVGCALFTSGLFYTGFAESYIQFLVSYGMISSIGTSMSMASFSLALNTYFKLKRNLASSFSITITGIGPIVLPLLITHLLSSYGWRWTVFIVSALATNAFVGALLLQPVKWHLQRPGVEDRNDVPNGDSAVESAHQPPSDTSSLFGCGTSFIDPAEILGRSHSELNLRNWISQSSLQRPNTSNYQEIPRGELNQRSEDIRRRLQSVTNLDNDDYGDMMKSTLYVLESSSSNEKPIKYASIETLDERSSSSSPVESKKLLSGSSDKKYVDVSNKTDEERSTTNENMERKQKCIFNKLMISIKKMYDLDLFLDLTYINLLIGLSIATVGELIFSLLTPFIVTELGLSLRETALFMSITAVTDVVFRFLSPLFAKCFKLNSRIMYIMSISILLITRASLLLCKTFPSFVAVAVFLGIGKGFRTVYWILVVPDYVPLNKLASASAFQSLCNGISLLISGPLIGTIISRNDNKYANVIFAANFLTFTTIVMWTIEFIVAWKKKRRSRTSEA